MNDEYMSDDMFEALLESVREGGAILRGEKEASRIFIVEPPDDLEPQCPSVKNRCLA